MKRILAILLILLFGGLPLYSAPGDENVTIQNPQIEMRDYDGIELPAGTFIPAVSAQEISTQYCPEGYKVKFIATNDLFLYDTKIIPKDTELYGYIEKINEPIVGTNASMKIKITKIVFQDGFEIPIRGYVHTSNNNLIGGELTQPAEFVKMPHYQSRFQGWYNVKGATLQIRPGRTRKMGEHTRIAAGVDLIIILTAPAWITHTLTN